MWPFKSGNVPKMTKVDGILFQQYTGEIMSDRHAYPVDRWEFNKYYDGNLKYYFGDRLLGEASNVIGVGIHTFEVLDEKAP